MLASLAGAPSLGSALAGPPGEWCRGRRPSFRLVHGENRQRAQYGAGAELPPLDSWPSCSWSSCIGTALWSCTVDTCVASATSFVEHRCTRSGADLECARAIQDTWDDDWEAPAALQVAILGESCGPFRHVLNRWHLLQAFTLSLFLVLGAAVERGIVVRVQPCVDCCMAPTASRTDPRQRHHSISHPPMAVAGFDRLAGSRLRGLRRHLRVHLGGRVRAWAHAAEGLPRVARGAGPDGRGVGGLHRVCQGFARPLARRAPGRGLLSARFARNAGAPCD
jgi:hypothetical protein